MASSVGFHPLHCFPSSSHLLHIPLVSGQSSLIIIWREYRIFYKLSALIQNITFQNQARYCFARRSLLRFSPTCRCQSKREAGQRSQSVRGKVSAGEAGFMDFFKFKFTFFTHLAKSRPLTSAAGVGTKLASFLTWSFSPHLARCQHLEMCHLLPM